MFLRNSHYGPVRRNHVSRGLTTAMLMLALAGCVSTPDTALTLDETPPVVDAKGQRIKKPTPLALEEAQQLAQTPSAEAADTDPVMTAGTAAATADAAPEDAAIDATAAAPADLGGLTMQSTGINASRSSIFSSRTPVAVDTGGAEIPAYAPTTGANPAFNNVYSRSPDAQPDATTDANPGDVSQATGRARGKAEDAKDRPINAIAFRKTDYIGADDLPLSMAAGFYASNDLYTRDDDDRPAGLMKLASLSGLARTAAHGLRVQNSSIDVSCFKPKLVNLIKTVERHFGKRAVVTSGYRDIARNRRVGGVEGSLHINCDAADVQIDGVSKWDVAEFVRAQPGRGGVGTYCHTASVHIDIGRARDWNWRCRRKEA